jgi:type II secretory pathway pseudopilin PulG
LSASAPRRAFTLVEVLIATAVTLLMMALVVTVFGLVGDSVSASRATMETVDRLRAAQIRLQADVDGVTAPTLPPLDPAQGAGYFEIIEGAVGPVILPQPRAPAEAIFLDEFGNLVNYNGVNFDTTVGDNDDMLMFTTRSVGEPFIGRFTFKDTPQSGEIPDGSDVPPGMGGPPQPFNYRTASIQSTVAEVCWFLRGNKLYRRQLLIRTNRLPDYDTRNNQYDEIPEQVIGFYAGYDISVHQEGGAYDRNPNPGPVRLVYNTLGDLTRRENRYAHQPHEWPHDVSFFQFLGLPTLRESSDPNWPFPMYDPPLPGSVYTPLAGGTRIGPAVYPLTNRFGGAMEFDAWNNPNPWTQVDFATGDLVAYMNTPRIAEDVILTNVLSFDVKVWDPDAPIVWYSDVAGGTDFELLPEDLGYVAALTTALSGTDPNFQIRAYGAYVDLGYYQAVDPSLTRFAGGGDPRSQMPLTYDTHTRHYEYDGRDQNGNGTVDEGTDGIDNPVAGVAVGGVDDAGEMESPPPYPVALRGIQVKIRVFEPDSRTVREVTIVKEFLPE